MTPVSSPRPRGAVRGRWTAVLAAAALLGAAACGTTPGVPDAPSPTPPVDARPPSPDPRIGLEAGLFDAGEAFWNLERVSHTPPPREFVGFTNSDLAFTGDYVIQGNYNGFQVWDISSPARPRLVRGYVCPASQSDVSVYRNLLFVSGEGMGGRLDCGTEGVQARVSPERLRGIRIFDISDIASPRYIGNVQTCRGSHTHTVLKDPDDDQNVYVYISGSASVRPEEELPGCSAAPPQRDPNTALFRIEVIRVPLAAPEQAHIATSPRIFEGLTAPPRHGPTPAEIEEARARGQFIVTVEGREQILSGRLVRATLDSIVAARNGTGQPTAADTAAFRELIPSIERRLAEEARARSTRPGPTQCHDITVYPAAGYAGGACEGYGILLDIRDPVNPTRLTAVADSNFSYWHSATFDNAGTKVIFTDEWGGGSQPKCRATDPPEWGANAIFTIGEGGELEFESYYKLPAPQTSLENCVAHNGSLIPVPGRDIMVQGWYQGGISVFEFTDPANPVEIAFFDRGPLNPERMESAGSWSAYWYNGVIVSSEIARGLDILRLAPSAHLTANEIEAARSVRLDYLNAQGQPRFEWPATFALAGAYVDQLERSGALSVQRVAAARAALRDAEGASGSARRTTLTRLAGELDGASALGRDGERLRALRQTLRDLAGR